jgi:hypothetical protein
MSVKSDTFADRDDYFDWVHSGPEMEDCSVCGKPDPSRCVHVDVMPDTEARCSGCGTRIPGPSEWCRVCRKSDPFIQVEEYRP